ncbi:uncharacterized protein LOC117244630 [Parus major]|uniref:uncharacterized protein LOC117244630 n=1 Tax=Parus major TaxID=9157 RepID=UPI0014443910|nr:uncharacterized protein LOC117244630 [Parus major]
MTIPWSAPAHLCLPSGLGWISLSSAAPSLPGSARPLSGAFTEPWNQQSHGTMELQSHGITEPWNYRAMELQSHGIPEPWNHGITEPWNHETTEPWNPRAMESWSHRSTESQNHRPTESQNHRMTRLEETSKIIESHPAQAPPPQAAHGTECHTQSCFNHSQGWWLHHCPGGPFQSFIPLSGMSRLAEPFPRAGTDPLCPELPPALLQHRGHSQLRNSVLALKALPAPVVLGIQGVLPALGMLSMLRELGMGWSCSLQQGGSSSRHLLLGSFPAQAGQCLQSCLPREGCSAHPRDAQGIPGGGTQWMGTARILELFSKLNDPGIPGFCGSCVPEQTSLTSDQMQHNFMP